MTPEQFCYWLQGRVELLPEQAPSAEEWAAIRNHLATTFKKETSPLDQYRERFGQMPQPIPAYKEPQPYWKPDIVYVESPILPYTVTC